MKKKTKRILILICLIIAIIFMIFLLIKQRSPKNKLLGSWTTDNVTIYEFNKKNKGKLVVSLNEYKFTYKIEDNKIFIDFDNEKSIDTEYTYSFKNGKLILKNKNGEFTFNKNE